MCTNFVYEFAADAVRQVAKKRFQHHFHGTPNITIILCSAQLQQQPEKNFYTHR